MCKIIEKVKNVDENSSDDIKEALSVFFLNLSKHIYSSVWLKTLQNIIIRFPKYCISHRNTIDMCMIKLLDSQHKFLVVEAAKCAHVLQQVRPSQEKTATAKSCWRDQMALLCGAVHTLIDTIFVNAVDIFRNGGYFQEPEDTAPTFTSALSTFLSNSNITKDVISADENSVNNHTVLCRRLQNVMIFIQAMFVEVYPVAKPVRTQVILDVIVRALSVSSNNTNALHIADLKIEALRTLDALTLCLGANLLPFSALVFRLTMQTIRWTTENSNDDFRLVRCQAYSSLSSWLMLLYRHKPDSGRSDGKAKSLEDELVCNIIQDITPARHIVQLTMSTFSTKNMSKKARKRLANTMMQESSISSHMPGDKKNKQTESFESNDDVVIAALECAEVFLTVCGNFLKPSSHKQLQERLIRECFNIEQYSESRSVSLLRTLEAARKSVPGGVPPPTQYCMQVYSQLSCSTNRKILKLCSQALRDITMHLHCSPPSLNFKITSQEVQQTHIMENKNKVSERNRKALESLLGHSRFPSQDAANSPIIENGGGEPTNKKVRFDEDIVDNISISSQSSIEISDESDIVEVCDGTLVGRTEPNNTINGREDSMHDIDIGTSDVIEADCTVDNNHNIGNRSTNIYDARTQLPKILSNDTIDGQGIVTKSNIDHVSSCDNHSGLNNDGNDIRLSPTDSDDIEISCAQHYRGSQDIRLQSNDSDHIDCIENVCNNADMAPKENGVREDDDAIVNVEADSTADDVLGSKLIVKTTANDEKLTVQDMMADFVDEIGE